MREADVQDKLIKLFAEPLGECAHRLIVFWHDFDGSFEELFDQITADGLTGEEGANVSPRPLAFAKVEKGGMFALKRRILREEPDSDFLVYTPAEKDFSERGLQGNWLADVELVAEHFQADFTSLLASELGATDQAFAGLRDHGKFFNAASRRASFKQLMPHAQTATDVSMGIIGSVLSAPELTTEAIIHAYLRELSGDGDPLGELAKYGVDQAFSNFMVQRVGYKGNLSSTKDLVAHVLVTALSVQLPEGSLSGLEGRISKVHGQYCLNAVHSWIRSGNDLELLYDYCRMVEELCGLPKRLSKLSLRDLGDADVVPCINECILTELFQSMAAGADRGEEAHALVQHRRSLCWYDRLDERFMALDAAAEMQHFYRIHAQAGFHLGDPVEVWRAYTSDWYQMDTVYRSFRKAYDACQRSLSEVPTSVDGGLEELSTYVENLYVNWFLKNTNGCWVNAAAGSWDKVGSVGGIARQVDFFADKVAPWSGKNKKVLVIVSDALRFEVAAELAQLLERDTRGTVSISSMQACFPSITEFGMAALLPHHAMGYSPLSDSVTLDGMPMETTPQREAALRAFVSSGVCVQSKKLMQAKSSERRDIVGDASVVYVYHNQIDAVGEQYSTEDKVFDACDDAMEDIVALVKMAVNQLHFSRVLITSDHGFIYTNRPLEESQHISADDIGEKPVLLGRRYAILGDAGEAGDDTGGGPLVRVDMGYLSGCPLSGVAPRDCVRIKKAGSGESYVHGGVSLQELCVPVLEYRDKRAGQSGYEEREQASLKLVTTNRRITSMLFRIELLQEEPVGGKVLPANYELVMCDSDGDEVSNQIDVGANLTSADATSRAMRVQMELRAGVAYDSHATYYLVCRDAATKVTAWQEEFHIDIAFAPLDDFGF